MKNNPNFMKTLKKFFKIILLLIVLVLIGLWLFSRTLHPTYKGSLAIKNISEQVTVIYDTIGVPHINAQNEQDAYTALGYVHAQDRLWQMELIRRIAAGRLSEVFGKDLLRTDVFFSGLGIEEAAAKTIKNLDTTSKAYQLTAAYLNGINQFIEEGATPVEFYLVGLEKEKYTLKDVYNVFGYMAFSFAVAHKTDPLLSEIKEKLGSEYLNEIGFLDTSNTTLIKNGRHPEVLANFSKAMNTLYDNLPISSFIGSNSWVIGADKTKNGKVIFANDPHIAFSQPSVWYQAHIKTPNYEIYGFNLALTPFPLLGHNREYAYGLTMLENDDVDFYYETENPENTDEYLTPVGYKSYEVREKSIKIKDLKDTVYTIKVSQHGPIMNNVIEQIKDERPIAMQWIYTKLNNKLLDVSYQLSHANSLSEFKEGAAMLHAPGLNIMYGDAKDNIAWFASGKLYKYRDSLNTKLILEGASGFDEIETYYDFDQNPQAINPSWNYVYSANNQPEETVIGLYPGYYLPKNRASRIVSLLEAKNDFTKEDVATMLFDVTSTIDAEIVGYLNKSIDKQNLSDTERKSLQIIKQWNGFYGKEELAPTIYNRFVFEFLAATFKDELGDSFTAFLKTHVRKKITEVQAKRTESIWWNNTNTDLKETKQEIVTMAFKSTVAFLSKQLGSNIDNWYWKRVLSVEHNHPMGKVAALRSIFNVGPFETDGGNEVINNQIFPLDSSGVYKVTAGPSSRRVVDFSDVENSLGIVPTGQSGNVFSPYYKDQAQKFLKGEFVKMMLNQKEIKKSENKLILKPVK